MQIVVILFCDTRFDLVPLLNLNINPKQQALFNTRNTLLLLATQQNTGSLTPLSHAAVYGRFMNNAISVRIRRWREDASLCFKHRLFDI